MHTIIVYGIRKLPLVLFSFMHHPLQVESCATPVDVIVIGAGMARSMHVGGGGAGHQFPPIGIGENIYQQNLDSAFQQNQLVMS